MQAFSYNTPTMYVYYISHLLRVSQVPDTPICTSQTNKVYNRSAPPPATAVPQGVHPAYSSVPLGLEWEGESAHCIRFQKASHI